MSRKGIALNYAEVVLDDIFKFSFEDFDDLFRSCFTFC